jgi:serine/threonine protein kinase
MDVWSLGVTLYTMLAAEMPFEGDAEKRRARILACKWTAKNFFSPRVIRLLNGIFVEPTRRLLLADLQNSEFAQNYPVQEPAFVDAAKEVLVPEEGVLGILEREFGLSAKKVGESVKGYSLDRFRAHYYLVLARQMAAGQGLLGVGILTKYKKQRKSSASKLEPIARTPIKPNKTKDTDLLKVPLGQTENMRIRRGSVNLDPPTVRVRRERTPESPRKLKSSLALYE